ncbi:MAG: response regulator [Polyangiaceae bacterium]|nr:response regulator [Polyangiaceae bacterium]
MSEREHDVESEPTLLVVDDDEVFRTTMGKALGARGFAVTLAANAVEAEAHARAHVMEYALVDVRMPGPTGIELVERLRAIDEGTRIVVMTGYGTIATAVEAMRKGAIDFLTKPVNAATCERALLGTRESDAPDEAIPSLERVEWEYIQRVLNDCGGNVSDAARKLRVHRRSLQRKLGRHAPRT